VARGSVMHQNRLCRPCLQRRRVWSVHMMPSYKLGFQHSFPYMMLPQAPDQASFPSARSAVSYTYDKRNKYESNSAASLQATMVRLTSSSSLGWFLVQLSPHNSLLLVMHLIRAKQVWWASCTPLTFFNYLCSQSPHNSIDQALIHCTSYESWVSKPWLISDIYNFFTRTCVPNVPNMINYIFSTHLQLLYLQQEWRPYVSDFPLGCCDPNTLSVTVITAA
jgi:hypothetical protein